MENTFNNIHYYTIYYKINIENGYYEKQNYDNRKLPNDLKIEPSVKDFLIHQGARDILRGRIKNGKYSFFTGLIPLNANLTNRVYYGNTYEFVNKQKKVSLLVVQLSENHSELTVYYFSRFYKENRTERINFVSQFISTFG